MAWASRRCAPEAGATFADAQGVVARWYGFENWSTLVEFVAAVTQEDPRMLAAIIGKVPCYKCPAPEGDIRSRDPARVSRTESPR
jgi:hypothetical protein